MRLRELEWKRNKLYKEAEVLIEQRAWIRDTHQWHSTLDELIDVCGELVDDMDLTPEERQQAKEYASELMAEIDAVYTDGSNDAP